jgi:preprotein translocase subunit YajC
MSLFSLSQLIAMGAPPGTQQDPRGAVIGNLGIMAIMVVMFYFVLIRPQQKKAKQHSELLKAVKPGDKVSTSGGILGVVVTVKEKSLVIRSSDAKLEVTKAAVAEITERGGEASQS